MIITAKMLEDMGACAGPVRQFREVFGEQVVINKGTLFQAYIAELDIVWFIGHFLNIESFYRYMDKRTELYGNYRIGIMSATKYYDSLSEFVDKLISDFEAESQLDTGEKGG